MTRSQLLACRVALPCSFALPVLLVLALASAANAQTPILTLQATPSPFGTGTSIAITAEVALNAPVESFCDPAPPTYCAVRSIYASVQVTGSNGFSDSQDTWTDWALLQTSDPGPGQTMQATTYTASGIVIVTHCRVDPSDPETCMEPPQDYEEQGVPIQAVVHPIPAPSISSVSPGIGAVGTFVEVHGAHFGTSGTLTFNGTEAAGYDLLDWTSTRIRAFVPGAATTGPVVVTTGGGPSPGVPMTVTPDISQLTPGSGTVGQSVTITGTGFGSSGTVTFNGVAATTVPSWTTTSITATVPSGATSGAVVVRVLDVPSTGKYFIVTSGSPGITETIQYYHTDALGSVRLITDAGGQVVATNDYLPFGDDWQPTGDLDLRGFAGMERTWHTGIASWGPLNYAGARYYHSQTGRFTSPDDSIYIDPLNPQTWNLYAYVMNNPLAYVDPSGHQAVVQGGQSHGICVAVFCSGTEEIDWSAIDAYWRDVDLSDFDARSMIGSILVWDTLLNRRVVDFSAGLGDALLLGAGPYLREAFGIDVVDRCTTAYRAGAWSSFTFGAARVAYAAVAKGASILASSGAQASAFRGRLRNAGRLGVGSSWRQPNLARYGTDEALRAAAGRTNPVVNAWGAGTAAAGAAGALSCGSAGAGGGGGGR